MIHEDGMLARGGEAYVERWRAQHARAGEAELRFVTDPTWRAYVITYTAGRELCRAYVGGDPARFRTLAHRARADRRPDRAPR